MGSIPFWPIGAEYRVSFPHPLSKEQLEQLRELNSLRGSVTVAFINCEMTEEQIDDAVETLKNCDLFRVVGNEITQLAK